MVNTYLHKGGNIIFNYISPQRLKDFNIQPLADALVENQNVNALLCLFSGQESNMFLQQLNLLPRADSIYCYVSPAMLEEQNVSAARQEWKPAVKGFIPWHSSLSNKSNNDFIDAIRDQSRRDPNIFSLLGWESGLILHEWILSQATGGEDFIKKMVGINIDSPRGPMTVHHATQQMLAPFYWGEIKNDGSLLVSDPPLDPISEWESFINENKEAQASGWLNTYLCY
jgi:branched-chain amino acid transport system substrate-binding protein